jgi:ATP-dependent DNA ligase
MNEIKYDGYRTQARIDAAECAFSTANSVR